VTVTLFEFCAITQEAGAGGVVCESGVVPEPIPFPVTVQVEFCAIPVALHVIVTGVFGATRVLLALMLSAGVPHEGAGAGFTFTVTEATAGAPAPVQVIW
jgi:hypothetical protein